MHGFTYFILLRGCVWGSELMCCAHKNHNNTHTKVIIVGQILHFNNTLSQPSLTLSSLPSINMYINHHHKSLCYQPV